jgi:spermidine/putrescine-binding protein
MFDNSRDAIGIALKRLGYSYNTTDEEELGRRPTRSGTNTISFRPT